MTENTGFEHADPMHEKKCARFPQSERALGSCDWPHEGAAARCRRWRSGKKSSKQSLVVVRSCSATTSAMPVSMVHPLLGEISAEAMAKLGRCAEVPTKYDPRQISRYGRWSIGVGRAANAECVFEGQECVRAHLGFLAQRGVTRSLTNE